jgi:hypothetical protein
MRTFARSLAAGALLPGALLALAACSNGDGPTAPRAGLDVAGILASVSLPALANGAGAVQLGIPYLTGGFVPLPTVPASCEGDGLGTFTCRTFRAGGLDVSVRYVGYDASGAVLPSLATPPASIAVRSSIQGTIQPNTAAGGTPPMTIATTQDLTVGGLLARERTLEGTTRTSVQASLPVAGATRTLRSTTEQTVVGVRFAAPTAAGTPWPTAGTVTNVITTTIDGDAPFTVTQVVTFTPTGLESVVRTSELTTTMRCTGGPDAPLRCQ